MFYKNSWIIIPLSNSLLLYICTLVDLGQKKGQFRELLKQSRGKTMNNKLISGFPHSQFGPHPVNLYKTHFVYYC